MKPELSQKEFQNFVNERESKIMNLKVGGKYRITTTMRVGTETYDIKVRNMEDRIDRNGKAYIYFGYVPMDTWNHGEWGYAAYYEDLSNVWGITKIESLN